MGRVSSRFTLWTRSVQAAVLAVAVCFSMGATNPATRLYSLDHQLMCTCGCAEILGECNHVGCTESTQELAELRADIAGNMSDQQIYSSFVAKYGATVLAAPTTHGFDLIAWIAPFAVFAAALLGTILLIRRWGGLRGGEAHAAVAADLGSLDPAERERRERIRRETDIDTGSRGGL
jgi:cytochrome c-type biogenesis protein CcmH